jgi:hypothetical protein
MNKHMKKKIENKASLTSISLAMLWCVGEVGIMKLAMDGSKQAENLISFWAIFAGLMAVLAVMMQEALKKNAKSKPAFYVWFCNFCDILILLAFAWQGWFWCAGFWAFSTLIAIGIRSKDFQKTEPKED